MKKKILSLSLCLILIMSMFAGSGITANADSTGAIYNFDNQAASYVLGDNCEATTYSIDAVEGFSVNYTGESSAKMQIKLAKNTDIFFEYSNSAKKNNVLKSGANFIQLDTKNFVINIPVQTGDKIVIKYSAKGSTAPTVGVYGENPCITADADAVTTCTGKTEEEAVTFTATATKGGTAKIKETTGGMRLYSISVGDVSNIHTHTWSADWTKTETAHYHACTASGCSITDYSALSGADATSAAYGAHTYGEVKTETSYYTCSTCGYENATRKAEYDAANSSETDEMYRLYNPNSGEHFYTANSLEKDMLVGFGWNYEGIAWTAPKTGNPVYRLYNPNTGDHHYTPNEAEKDMLVGVGWNYEGIGWYSAGETPLYRLYNPNCTGAGSHHYTTNAAERDYLASLGWNDEGIGWYGIK